MKTHRLFVLMLVLAPTLMLSACEKSENLGDPHKNDGGAGAGGTAAGGAAGPAKNGGATGQGGSPASGGTAGQGTGRGGGGATAGGGGSGAGGGPSSTGGRGGGTGSGASVGSGGTAGAGGGGLTGSGGRGDGSVTSGTGGGGSAGRGNGGAVGKGGATGSGGSVGSNLCGVIAPSNGGGIDAVARYGSNGDLHIAYVDATNHWPRYAVRRTGVWQNELIQSLTPADAVSSRIDLAVDGVGTAHVVYGASWRTTPNAVNPDTVLRYATRTASGVWSAPVDIVPASEQPDAFAMGLDAQGSPYVAYGQLAPGTREMLVLLHHTPAGWSEELRAQVGETVGSPGDVYLTTDGGGRPFVYISPKLVVPGAAGYTVVPLPASAKPGAPPIAVNRAGTSLVMARDQGVIFGADPFWTDETLSALPFDRRPWVGLTSDERPVAAYSLYVNSTLAGAPAKYLTLVYRRDAAGWVTASEHDFTPTAGASNDVLKLLYAQPAGFDPAGDPYALGRDGDLRIYELHAGGQATSEIDVKLSIASDRGAVADAAGRLVVAFNGGRYDEPSRNGTYIAREGSSGAMSIARIDLPGSYVPASLIRDTAARLYLAGFDGKSVRLATSPGDGTWSSEVLATFTGSADGADSISIALGADGTPHVVYGTLDAGTHALWHVGRGETPTRVATDTLTSFHARAIADGTGVLYVTYIGAGQMQLARWNGTTWQSATAAGAVGTAFVDAGGRPCLVRLDSSTGQPIGVCLQASGFVEQPLGNGLRASEIRPTFVDDKGTPHLLLKIADGWIVVNGNTGATEGAFAALDTPSTVVTSAGVRLIHWNATEKRLYVTGC